MAFDYDWEGAAQARIESGMSLVEFYARRIKEFSRDGKIPSYETMRLKFRAYKYKYPDKNCRKEFSVSSNLTVVDLQPVGTSPSVAPSITGRPAYPDKCRVRISRPDGTVIDVETHRPEWFVMKLISAGAILNEF